jgi:hypothetical protein
MSTASRFVIPPASYRNEPALIGTFSLWFEANKKALIERWWQCDIALRTAGGVAAAAEDDFVCFAKSQWDTARARVMQ